MSNESPAVTYSSLITHHPSLRAVDVDLHHQITDWKAVAPYVPEGLRWRVLRPAGPPMARHGYKKVGVTFGDAPIPTDEQGRQLHPAGDPAWVKEQYLDRKGVDRAILTGGVLVL